MLNDIRIHGYLGKDPELSEVEGRNGTYKKVVFSVGVSRDYGDETDWFRCVMYGNRADVIDKYFRKGSQIIVLGRMESYKPKNDPDHKAWILKATGFDFCDKKGGQGQGQSQGSGSGGYRDIPESMEEIDEDVPF